MLEQGGGHPTWTSRRSKGREAVGSLVEACWLSQEVYPGEQQESGLNREDGLDVGKAKRKESSRHHCKCHRFGVMFSHSFYVPFCGRKNNASFHSPKMSTS